MSPSLPSEPAAATNSRRTDVPADLASHDAFGHEDYARAAVEVLLPAKAPFTLGIFGDWGIGKTTIIREIGKGVQEAGNAYVEFDVWRYEDDAFRRQFLREVAEQLANQKALKRWGWRRRWRRYEPKHDLRDLEVDIPIPEEKIHVSLRAFAAALGHAVVIGGFFFAFLHSSLPHRLWGHRSLPSSSAEVAAAVIAGAALIYGVISGIFRVERRFVTVRRIEEPERFESKFRSLLARARPRRVVIAIDNLDRCSPPVVDKFLATIKTYLETASRDEAEGGTDAVFVIATDEAAVRRHLTARELAEQPRLPAHDDAGRRFEAEQEQLREAEYQVDEYLRKFFNAVIRVRPLLPEDVKLFTREQLQDFFAEHMPEPEAAKTGTGPELAALDHRERLVSMVTAALRRNPRRIKQFVHNLDARLRTIKQRETSKRIAAGLSADILGIAKIAIIEEQWRDEYDELEKNPRKLAQWHKQALTGQLEPRELATFLRFNQDIFPENVAAVVNLKLESDDLGLPDFGEFRDAVADGDFDVARDVIGSAPAELQSQYPAHLPEILERERLADGFVEARNVLDAALSDPPLGIDDDDVLRSMVADAIADPRVVSQLTALDPRRLFPVLDRLGVAERRKARRPFLNLAAVAPRGPEAVNAVAEELAARVTDLDGAERDELQQTIGGNGLSPQFRAAWLPLIEADRTLLTDGASHDAFQSLLTGEVDPQAADFRVVVLGLSQGLGEQYVTQFADRLRELINEAVANDRARLPRLIEASADFVLALPTNLGDAQVQSLLTTIRSSVGPIVDTADADGVAALLQVAAAGEHLESISSVGAAAEAKEMAETVAAAYPDATARAILATPTLVDGALRDDMRSHMRAALQAVPPDAEVWVRIAGALSVVDEDGVAAVGTELGRRIDLGQSDSVAEGVEQLLRGDQAEPIAAWLRSEAGDSVLGRAGSLVDARLIDTLRAGPYSTSLLPAARFVVSRWADLEPGERRELVRMLVGWFDVTPEASEALAPELRPLAVATVSEKGPLVRALIRVIKQDIVVGAREAALDAARQLAAGSKPLSARVEQAGKEFAASST